jgi:aryl sulfotransferase
MTTARPERSRVYKSHHLDSTRWDAVPLRDDDIIISTSLKTGTTWTQRIVSLLVFGPGPLPASLNFVSPWIDAVFWAPVEIVRDLVEGQTHRRFFKSHLAFDALPYDESVKYIYVGRDGRDVFMSLWNHYGAYNDAIYGQLNDPAKLVGEPLAPCPDDIHALFADWVSRGSFPWEKDGYPFWSHFHHAQTFWDFRHLPNVHFTHFNDMKADLEREMRRIAAFLDIDVPEDRWAATVEGATFEAMKRDADSLLPELEAGFKGGAQTFVNKGTNERWKDVLTPDELAKYDRAVARAVTPDCARWLEQGSKAGDPKAA